MNFKEYSWSNIFLFDTSTLPSDYDISGIFFFLWGGEVSIYHMIFPFIKPFHKFFQYDTRYITLCTAVSRSFASDVIRKSIMTSRKVRCFRAIFARTLLKIHTFCMKYSYFLDLACDKRIWNEFSFHTVFMKLIVCFISPRQRLGDIKHTTHFINTVWNENSFQILYLYRIWNEKSFHTVFMKRVVCFISPSLLRGDIKHTTSFINMHKYRMKWKFISDSFYHILRAQNCNLSSFITNFTAEGAPTSGRYLWRHKNKVRRLGLSKCYPVLCHNLIYEIAIFHSINEKTCDKMVAMIHIHVLLCHEFWTALRIITNLECDL